MWEIFLNELANNLWLQAAALWILFDTIMGCCRAAGASTWTKTAWTQLQPVSTQGV